MKRFIFIALVILALLCVEIIFFSNFNFLKVSPNLLFLTVIFFSVYLGLSEGLFAAIFAGLLKDVFSLSAAGMNLWVFVICALLINRVKRYIYRENIFTIFSLTLGAGLVNIFLGYFMMCAIKGIYLGWPFLLVAISEAGLTAILAVPLFFYLKRCALRFYI